MTEEHMKDLESAANTLRGVAMHLGIVGRGRQVDLTEPLRAIADCIEKIDRATESESVSK